MNKKHLREVSLVLGGARSGKSKFAENLILASDFAPVYLASAEARDAEMAARIEAHRAAREGAGWKTVEAPLDVVGALAVRKADEAVLFDCATLWLSNLILAARDPELECKQLQAAIAACPARIVVVSNEVGQGVVPDNALARRFRDAQGQLNQDIAARAGLVVAVMAGLPMVLKGALP